MAAILSGGGGGGGGGGGDELKGHLVSTEMSTARVNICTQRYAKHLFLLICRWYAWQVAQFRVRLFGRARYDWSNGDTQ